MIPTDEEKLKIAQKAEELYDRYIGPIVEDEYSGKIITVDVDSGDYEVGDTIFEVSDRIRQRRPNARLHAMRVGYDAAYAFSPARLTRRKG